MDTEGLRDPVSVEGRQTTSTSLEDRLTAAQNTRNHCQCMYRSLQRETNELTSLPMLDLLGVDRDRLLKEACSSYIPNCAHISELFETLYPDDLEANEDSMFECRRKMQRLVDDLTRLRAVRDGYKGSLNMKRLTNELSRIELLTGPNCQSDVQSLHKYVVRFRSDLTMLKCNDIKLLYNEIAELSADIFKRSDRQLLDSHSPSVPSSLRSTTLTPSRPSTLTLKLPTFQGSLLNWNFLLTSGKGARPHRC